jgi:hypothetical protein
MLILGFYGLFRYKILSLILIFTLQSFESNVVGQNQSVCKKGPTRGSISLAVLVGKKPVMIKELVEVNEHETDEGSELETVKFVHHLIQYHQYKIGASDDNHEAKKLMIRYQIAQKVTFKLMSNSRWKWHYMINALQKVCMPLDG